MLNGGDFIQLAGRLIVLPGNDEASYRTAVSRAYYGAYHATVVFLRDLGFEPPSNLNVHGYLPRQLVNSGQTDAKFAGNSLTMLHRNRLAADYEPIDERFATPDFARRSVELAHDFLSILDACRNEPALTEIQTGIADYQTRLP